MIFVRVNRLFSRAALAAALPAVVAVALAACSGEPDRKAPPMPTAVSAPDRFSPAAFTRSRHRIDSLEALIRAAVQSPTKAPEIRLTMQMIQAYQYFAADFPKDARAPESLDRAAQLWSGVLGDHQKAVEYYEKAYQQYPKYKNLPQLLLQQGVACEAAHDTASAAISYHRLLTAYPRHPLAEQARGLLKLMRMTANERQQMFGQGK